MTHLPNSDRRAAFRQARRDPEYRAAAAEESASYYAWQLAERRNLDSRIHAGQVKLHDLATSLVDRGHDEYTTQRDEADAELRLMRADEELRRAHAAVALDRLPNNHHRVEFATFALRVRTDYWPTEDDVEQFLVTDFGMTPGQTRSAIVLAICEEQPRSGVIASTGHILADRMNLAPLRATGPRVGCT